MSQYIEAGTAIELSRNYLANAILDREYELQLDSRSRFGKPEHEKCIQDTFYHLSILTEALKLVSPALFYDYIAWTKIRLIALGNSSQDFEIKLRCIQEILGKQLPSGLNQLAHDYLEQVLRDFSTMPDKQASFINDSNPLQDLARNYLDALLRGDQKSARRFIMDGVDQGVKIKDIYIHVFQCVQREIGQLWQTNKISIVQEHYCSAATQLIMAQLYPQIISGDRNGRKIVLACVSGELHEIGVRMVSDFFEMEGWDAYYVGANTPAIGIIEALIKHDCNILALAATMTLHVSKIREMIDLVRSSEQGQSIKILVGGYPFNLEPSLWRRVGADAFALDAQDAIKVANNLYLNVNTNMQSDHIATMTSSEPMSEQVMQRESSGLYNEEMMQLNNELVNTQRELSKKNSELLRISLDLKIAHDNLELRVEERTQELSLLNIQLSDEIEERIAKEEEIYKLAFNDQLTGLPNRRLFYDRLDQSILQAMRSKKSFQILFLDLDSFKMVNDTMGHAQGDELLKKVAERLKSTLRESDVIARVGGDEFLILIRNASDKESIEKVCRNIIKAIKEPFKFYSNEIYITTSIGVSIYPQDGEDVETLVKNADIAMYVAKENGKGKYAFCTELMKKNLKEVMMLSNDLYRALESNELELYYQPQVAVLSGEIVGLEALLRWNHPNLGLIGPADFIPIAEKTGLIVVIGEWVLRTACAQTKVWQDAGFPNLSIAVNLSVNQIVSRKIVKQVSEILSETGLNPMCLELEVTENIFIKDIDDIIDTLNELKNLKIRIAIDDFGTGYSSLSYLKQFPLDRIKIAKAFIDGIDQNFTDESIISAIIVLGKKLGLDLIAEGVETDRQFQFLKIQMCDEIQGYYYHRPLPVREIEKLLKAQYFSERASTNITGLT